MGDFDFKLDGFEELEKKLAKIVKKYPDFAENKLEETGKKFKKRVVEITKATVNTGTGRLIKGYKLDKITGYGMNMSKDFRATAPHFHLVEYGHNLVSENGKLIGWINGKFIVRQVREEFKEEMPYIMQDLYDEIKREVGIS